jgi:hypothetical protein
MFEAGVRAPLSLLSPMALFSSIASRRRGAGTSVLALALFGLCQAALAADTIPTQTGNKMHDTIAAFSPRERNQVVDNLLRHLGNGDCDVVDTKFIEYRQGDSSTWRATCSDGRRFLVNLNEGSEGSVTIAACGDAASQKAQCGN